MKTISSRQLATPSLCPGWNVRTELNHLVGGMRVYAAELSGTRAAADHEADWLGDDNRDAYTQAARLDRAAWHRPGVLDTTVRLGFGPVPGHLAALIHLTEVLVHGADLAVVTEQQTCIDDGACEELLAVMRTMDFAAFRRPGMFGPERAAPTGTPAHRRLLAFLGRDFPEQLATPEPGRPRGPSYRAAPNRATGS
ncbi:TIGR03086 family metal-binding protein [Actinoplanes sp. NPDC026623]|uniref:TIGR03086 family metal-binding protein n=1 Tax=Actinoplanes sp. NPDC026623 TaxID=3155610 RepID=UPI0033C30B7D